VRAVARRFAARGSRLVFCLVAEKDLVYADAAPPGVAGDRGAYAAVLAHLHESGVDAPDLLAALDAVRRAGEEPFFAADTHWTFAGASAAAEAAAAAVGLRVPLAERTSRVEDAFTTDSPADIVHYAGFGSASETVRAWATTALRPHVPLPPFVFRRVVAADGSPLAGEPLARDRSATVVGTSYSDYYVAPWFPAFVAHALDRPVRSHALGAAGAGTPLLRSAEIALAAGYTPLTFWEAPSSHVFAAAEPLEDVAEFFAFAPPKRSTLVLDAAAPGALSEGAAPPSDAEMTLRGVRRFRFRDGLVGADGGGGVGLKLAGDVRRGEVRVRATWADRSLAVRWRQGQAEITLPALVAGTTAPEIELEADDALVFWRRAALVVDAAREAAVPSTEGAEGARSFPAGTAASTGALLEVKLPPDGGGGRVVVRRRSARGAFLAADCGLAHSGATLYLDARTPEGDLAEVRILRDATPLRGCVVSLLPPPRP
jgi:hypothetical protein